MNKIKFISLAVAVAAMAFAFSCSSDDGENEVGSSSSSVNGGSSGSLVYEGQTYKTVKIGEQVWFAENLNYNVSGSKCYGEGGEVYDHESDDYITLLDSEVQANCDIYGRLYNWATAMALDPSCNSTSCSDEIQPKHRGICPEGWHIPSNADWDKLYRYVDGDIGMSSPYSSSTAGKHLKASTGWHPYEGIENLNTHEFSALPSGYGGADGDFTTVGRYGWWWSSNENEGDYAYLYYMDYKSEGAYWNHDDGGKGTLTSIRCVKNDN